MDPIEQSLPTAETTVLGLMAAAASLLVAWEVVRRWRLGVPVVPVREAAAATWTGGDVAAVIGTVLAVQVLAAGLVPAESPLAWRLLASVVGMVVAAGVGAWHLWVRGARWAELGLTVGAWKDDARLALGGLALVLWPLLTLASLLDQIEPYRHPIVEYLSKNRDSAAVALVILSAVVVAPVVEEFLFRRVLQGWLVRRLPGNDGVAAVALQALAFGLAHAGQGLAPVPLTMLGIVLGWLALRTGTLLPGILLHALFNAVSVAMILAGVGSTRS